MVAEGDIIGIGEFRQRATEIIRRVEETAQPVIIARRGRPVVEVRALHPPDDTLLGSVDVAPGVELTDPVVEPADWDAAT